MAFSSPANTSERIGVAAIVAAALAVASFFFTPLWALALAGLASVAGIVGFTQAASPRVRGGLISIAALVVAGISATVALLRAIF